MAWTQPVVSFIIHQNESQASLYPYILQLLYFFFTSYGVSASESRVLFPKSFQA